MKKTLIFSLLIVLGTGVFAQVHGFLGSRFFVSANFSLTPDLKKNPLNNSHDNVFTIRTPISGDVNFVAGNGVSLGARATFTNVTGTFYRARYNDYFYYSGIANYKTQIFSLYLEGHSKNAYSVIDNYFRFGVCLASLKNSEYLYTDVESNYSVPVSNDFPDSVQSLALNQSTAMSGFYYEFGNRVPLSDHFLFYYSLSGYLFPIRNVWYKDDVYPNITIRESNTYIRDLGKRRVGNTNMLNLNFGLVWAF